MDKYLFVDEPDAKRLELLRDNAEKTDMVSFVRNLTEDQRKETLEDSAKTSLEISALEEELKEFSKEIREKIKFHKDRLKTHLSEIKTNSREYHEECFYISDHAEGQMGIYTPEGELISQRPLRKEEMQTRMRTLHAANS